MAPTATTMFIPSGYGSKLNCNASGWTYGLLATQIWGIAETRSNAPTLNFLSLQPFVGYVTKNQWQFSIEIETSYNHATKDWWVPFNFGLAKLTTAGKQIVQFQAGARYWANQGSGGPDGWGFRFTVTLLFPK